MEKKYTSSDLEKVFDKVSSLAFAYLDKAVKELNSMDLKNADKFSEVDKQKFNMLHTAIAVGLDLTHRSYPLCYEFFPENKKNLDNALDMFKRFEKAKLLNKCECDYCKTLPVDDSLLAEEPVQVKPVQPGSVSEKSAEL